MLTKGAHKFKKKDIIINTTGDGPTLKGDSVPASSIVAFPEVFNDNLLSYPNTKVRNTGSPKKKLQEPTPWSPTCEKDGNEKPSALSVLKPADTCLLVQVKESHRLDNCVKDPTTLSTPISSSPRTRDSPGKKHKTSSNRTRKHATLKETQPPKTEWLISFSTLDNDASVLPKLPYQISNSNSVRPLSAQCSRRTSLVSLTSSRSSSPICNPSRKCTPLRPYSACLKKASMVQELKLKSSPSLSLNSQSVPFSSLTFEAKGFYSVKSRRQEHLSKELAIIQVNPTQREISKLSGVWKSLKTLAWKDTKKKDDLNLLNNSQYCNYQTALVPVSKSKSIIPAQSFTDARLFSKLETTSVVKSQFTMQSSDQARISDYQQFHSTSRAQFDNSKGKEKRELYKLKFPSTSIDSGTCTNSTSTDEMPCVVNKSSNSLSSVVVQKPDSLESIPLDEQQSCSTSNSTNRNCCCDSYFDSNATVRQNDRKANRDKKLFKQNSQYVEDEYNYSYTNSVDQHDESEETLPLQDASKWRRDSTVSSRTVKSRERLESKSDLSVPLNLVSPAACPQNATSHQQLTRNILRTTHINDNAYDTSSQCTCANNQRRKSSQHSEYQSSFTRSAGSQNSMYNGTNLATINTSRLSLESDYSSNASERNPLTSRLLQTSTVIDHELEVADDTKWREPNQSSDSEDSDVDAHSDVCESLESLVDHGIDSDVSISTEGSDDSDDESIDLNDEVKTFEERVIGDGTSISSPGVSNAISDDFTTISPTRDYYPVKEDSPIGTIGQMYPWLRFSLFPNIPPTINFRVMDSPPLNIPPEVKRILKWKSTAVTPAIIRRVLYNSGMRIVKRSRQWIGIWSKHMRANLFKTIKDFQKFNHFPGTFQIGRKDTLWRNHVRLRNIHGKKSYDFLPVTYVIPSDMKQLRHAWEKSSPNQMWIIKPPASARGSGIKIIHKFMQIPKIRPLIVQKYLSSPFLINGVKFDLRIYVYITSFYPLRIYVYKEGLVRFASVMYSSCPRTVSDRYMHLTNYSVNRKSVTYTANEDVNACKGHKWSLKALWGYLTEKGYDTTAIWNSIVDIVIKTIISCETTVSTLTRLNLKNANSSHELFGFDIILDSNLKPWLLEVNISPSLQSTSKLDASIKGQMCKDLLNLSGVNIPPHLEKSYQQSFLDKVCLDAGSEIESLCFDKRLYRSTLTAEERTKQIAFSRLERHEYLPTVLQNLLPDDIRHLVIAEDERSRAGQYIRVYPTITSHRYHKYFDRPRYYNHLFDAWEMQYANCRMEGIQRLVAACKNGLHVKAVVKESTKVSSPRTDVGRLSSTTSLRVRCCSRSATNRAIQRACRSARNLFARMRITRHCPASKKDLEDAAKSSHTGSGDHLLRSKASDKETEESSLRQTPVSPNSATPSDGLEEPYDGLSQQNKSSKDSKASVPNGNFDHPFKQPNYYTIKDHQLNLQNRGNDGATGMSATNVNGIRVPHCRGCALLSQNYRANILKKSVQEYNNAMEKDPKLDSAPVHHNSLVKSTYNQQTKTTAYTGHVGVDSN